MTIEQRNGRWRVIVDVGADPISHRRQRVTKTLAPGATKKDARDEEARLRLKGRPRARTKTVAVLLEDWYAGLSTDDYSPRTLQGYRQHIDRYLTPGLGNLAVRKLDVHRIETLYRHLRKTVSATTVKRIHATLSGAMKAAVRWGWIPASPCPQVDTGRQERHEVEPPSLSDIARILEHADEGLRNAVALAINTGARQGELCGLQWSDINFVDKTITFRRSIANVIGQGLVVVEARRKSRLRTVAIDPLTLAMLEARLERRSGQPSHYVLSDTPHGGPLSPTLLGHRWIEAAKRAGLSVRFHDLRHFHVTELLAAGLPAREVARRVGHASTQMTLNVYAHAVEHLDRTAADIVAARLALPSPE